MSTPRQSTEKKIEFKYRFTFPDQTVKEIHLKLSEGRLDLVREKRKVFPEWTKLSHFKCTNCPLSEQAHPRCPIAANLVEVADKFKDVGNHEVADVEITSKARTCKKRVPFQQALSSLVGIYMVTSGCPVMDKLRPLVATHLPFASLEETTYRAIGMYLVAQYYIHKNGGTADWDLKHLSKIYEEIQIVNSCFSNRISQIKFRDVSLNALIHLDCYARFTNMMLLERGLGEIERLFQAYNPPEDNKK
jgi:hypothetical protein